MTLLQSFMEDLLIQANTGKVVIIRDDHGSTKSSYSEKWAPVLKNSSTAPSFPSREPSIEALNSPPSFPSRKPSFEALDLQSPSLQPESTKYDSLEEFYKEVGFTRLSSYQRRRSTFPASKLYDLPPKPPKQSSSPALSSSKTNRCNCSSQSSSSSSSSSSSCKCRQRAERSRFFVEEVSTIIGLLEKERYQNMNSQTSRW